MFILREFLYSFITKVSILKLKAAKEWSKKTNKNIIAKGYDATDCYAIFQDFHVLTFLFH